MPDPRRILVVDDDQDIRDVLTRFFSAAGHEVHAAADGKLGLAEVADWEPHVVLLDLEMPRVSGLDVLRRIRADNLVTQVVAFSGHSAGEALGDDARRLGAVDFLVKPLDIEQLGVVVAAALGRSDT